MFCKSCSFSTLSRYLLARFDVWKADCGWKTRDENGSRNHAFRFGSVYIPDLSDAFILTGICPPLGFKVIVISLDGSLPLEFNGDASSIKEVSPLHVRSISFTIANSYEKPSDKCLNVFFGLPLTYMDPQCRTCLLRSCLTEQTGTRIRPWTSAVRLNLQG